MAEKTVRFGLNNVYYSVYDAKTSTYGTPKRIYGAVNLNISREGDSSTFYADNTPYFSTVKNAGYSGTLEIAAVEDQLLIDLLNYVQDGDGNMIEDAEAISNSFALLYEISSNAEPQRFCLYNCSLSRPETEANTSGDTIEPDTASLEITCLTRDLKVGDDTVSVVKMHHTSTGDTDTIYKNWFTAVPMPKANA